MLSHDAMFPQLMAGIATATDDLRAEFAAQLQSVTLAFNEECSTLLGSATVSVILDIYIYSTLLSDLRTRYDSSILLWEKFTSLSQVTRQWLDSALDRITNISASLEQPASLVSQLEVRKAQANIHFTLPLQGRYY